MALRRAQSLGKMRKVGRAGLAIIAKLGLAGYFLIVWDIVRMLVLGSGSRRTLPSAMRWGLWPSTRWVWICCSSVSSRRSEESGRTPILIFHPARIGNVRSSTSICATASLGRRMCANVTTYRGKSAAGETGKALGFDLETTKRLTQPGGNGRADRHDGGSVSE